MVYLCNYNLIDPNQFGFLPGRSCTLQLLRCLDDWTSSLDIGIPTDVILVDYAKAFDSVSHAKLCHILTCLGVGGNVYRWISDFLSGRSQYLRVYSEISELEPVASGVIQGSVIGPVLFTLFISDLQTNETLAVMPKFADDVDLYRSICGVDDHIKLASALEYLENWSNDWQLPIAAQKCNVFHIGRADMLFNYSLLGNTLNTVSLTKSLGVWMSNDLKSSSHCDHIVKTARQRASMIKRCFTSNDRNTLFWAFCVYVRPILEYASPVWSPYLIKDIDHVESVQRSFTKHLPGFHNKVYSERLKLLSTDSLEVRRLRFDLTLCFRLLHGLCDFDFNRFFEIRGSSQTRGHSLKLVVQPALRDCRKFFFANRVVKVWNALPENLVTATTLYIFKRNLKTIDLSKFVRWA